MRLKSAHQVKFGAVLSYCLIIINSLYGIIMTPFIIKSIGSDQYGVYKTIAALASSMMVMDLGIGGTVQRYVAKYRAEKKEEEIPNFMSMSLILSMGLNLLIVIVAAAICFLIDPIYGDTFTPEQISLARTMFILLSANSLVIVVENVLNGLITGSNGFIFGNGLKLFLLLFRIAMLLVFLVAFPNALTIVFVTMGATLITLFAELFYIWKVLRIQIRYSHWDMHLFFEAGKYTLLMFLTAIASQIFSNMDNIIIGAICGPALVTIYSVALMFFSMFQSLSAGIAGVMLPTVTNALRQNNGMQRVINIIAKAGKVQFILLGAALMGFVCIGQDFISVWMGPGYEDVYWIGLILLIPSMFELCINVCHAVLRAQNRLGFRTGITIASAALNAILTLILVNVWSYIGAAIATAASYIVCSLIAMNIYYSKVIKLPMLKIYGSILGKVSVCIIGAGASLYVFSRFVNGSWLAIVADILVFCFIYGILLLLFGLEKDEKKQIPFIRKFIKDKTN